MKSSVHESLQSTTNPQHEESVVYFTLFTFCVGLTLFSLACLKFLSAVTYRYLLPHIPAILHYNPDSISTYRLLLDDDMASSPSCDGYEPDYVPKDDQEDNESIDIHNDDDDEEEEPIASICAYCFDNIFDEPINPCTKCKRVCCADCVRAIFILACRDESSMPPRCCRRPIQLAYGRLVLSNDEIQEFKDKYDEWITAERSYCPVPSCSAFLNPRVFPQLRQVQAQAQAQGGLQDRYEQAVSLMHNSGSYAFYEYAAFVAASGSDGGGGGGGGDKPVIYCPKCDAAICLQCIHLAHDDDDDDGRECSRDDDINPELSEALVALRAKRCPKCRAAVRKSHGCSQMRCRCGAKWCWYCFRSVEECDDEPCVVSVEGPDLHDELYSSDESNDNIRDGGAEGDNNDIDIYDDRKEEGDGGLEDMIAFRASYIPEVYQQQDLSAHDLPPVTSNVDRRTEEECRVVPFNCLHRWYPVEEFESEASLTYDCERCWGQVYARLTDMPTAEVPSVGLVPVHRELVVDGETNPDYDIMQGHIMFRCWICSQTICNECRKECCNGDC